MNSVYRMVQTLVLISVFVLQQIAPAMAVCTGETCQQGRDSHGDIRITLHPDDQVRLWGLQNMELEKTSRQGLQAQQTICGYSTTLVGRFEVFSQNLMHLRSSGGQEVKYQLWMKKRDNGSWQELAPEYPVQLDLDDAIDPQMHCGGQANIRLRVRPAGKSIAGLSAGYYSDIVTLTLSPE